MSVINHTGCTTAEVGRRRVMRVHAQKMPAPLARFAVYVYRVATQDGVPEMAFEKQFSFLDLFETQNVLCPLVSTSKSILN